MTHDAIREQLALRLYDELTADEVAALDTHLARCAECRAFAADLERGLGAAAGPMSDDLPHGWRERLDAATRDASVAARPAPFWLGLAAGLAAGVLGALAWRAPDEGPAGKGEPPRFVTNSPTPGEPAPELARYAQPPPAAVRAYAGLVSLRGR